MGKQYVFWQTEKGKPYKINDGKCAPTALLKQVGEFGTDNAISWHLFDLPNLRFIVSSMMVVIDPVGNELNEADTRVIGERAFQTLLSNHDGNTPIDPNKFLNTANKEAAKFFQKPVIDYILLTNLSVSDLPSRRINIHDCQISELKRRTQFKMPELLCTTINEYSFRDHLKATKYLPVKVKTSGRSVSEASDKALKALSLLRGLWMLFATINKKTIRFGMRKEDPIGVIRTGPIQTLHQLNGLPATEMFWYEPTFLRDAHLFKPNNGWEQIKKSQQVAVRKLKKHPFGSEVEQLIMRYAEALNQTNLDLAFLQMWSILEKITDTIGAKYDETINRAVWHYKDRKQAKERLSFLRLRRNQYVHSARPINESDKVAYSIKSIIDLHLRRLIFNDMKVNSIDEYGKFLSLPTDIATLEKNRKKISYAIRLRNSK